MRVPIFPPASRSTNAVGAASNPLTSSVKIFNFPESIHLIISARQLHARLQNQTQENLAFECVYLPITLGSL